MIKKSLIALGMAAPMLMIQPAHAGRDFGAIYTDCGLGGLIAANVEEDSTANVLAIVTNVTWDLGTTAISSESTTPDSCARGDAQVAAFIYQSYDALEKDIASGYGDHLSTLKELNASGDNFEADLRSAFSMQVASAEYAGKSRMEKSQDLYDMVTQIN